MSLHCQATCAGEGVLARDSWDRGGRDGGDAQDWAAGEKLSAWRGVGDNGGLCSRDVAGLDGSDGASVAAGSLDAAASGVAHSRSCLASSSSARVLASRSLSTEQDGFGSGLGLATLPRARLSACNFCKRLGPIGSNVRAGMVLYVDRVTSTLACCRMNAVVHTTNVVSSNNTLNERALLLPVGGFPPRASSSVVLQRACHQHSHTRHTHLLTPTLHPRPHHVVPVRQRVQRRYPRRQRWRQSRPTAGRTVPCRTRGFTPHTLHCAPLSVTAGRDMRRDTVASSSCIDSVFCDPLKNSTKDAP